MQRSQVARKQDFHRWNDLQVDVSSVRLPVAQAPTWSVVGGTTSVLSFSGAADNSLYFNVQLPHTYREGTDIKFHIHYTAEDDTAGNVRWVFTHRWGNIGEAFPTATTVTTEVATPETTNHSIGEIATLTGTGKTISSIILCSLTRQASNAGDTYDSKVVYLVGADFHYLRDAHGSREERVK